MVTAIVAGVLAILSTPEGQEFAGKVVDGANDVAKTALTSNNSTGIGEKLSNSSSISSNPTDLLSGLLS